MIPGATVDITSTDTGAKQNLATNGSGYFEAPLMQPGNYSVTVEMTGFKKLTRSGLVLAVGQRLDLPLTLEVGAFSETITVTGEAPLLDTNSVSSSQTFDSKMVEGLPTISNMPIMLTRFAQGVNPSTSQSLVSQGFVDGTTGAAGSAVGGVGSNTYSIDGASQRQHQPPYRHLAELRHDRRDARRIVEFRRVDRPRHRPADFDDDQGRRQCVPGHRELHVLDEQVQPAEPQPEGHVHAQRARRSTTRAAITTRHGRWAAPW